MQLVEASAAAAAHAMARMQRQAPALALFQCAALAGVRWLQLGACASVEQLLAAGGALGGVTRLRLR